MIVATARFPTWLAAFSRSLPLLAMVAWGMTSWLAALHAAESPPNIVVIMADDMGYGDPGCYNPESKTATPAIDGLAQAGMRFRDAHAPAAVCVPTRYGLLTGRYPFRADLPWRKRGVIDERRMTLGSLLAGAGYRTACIGKWHLGFEGGPDYDFRAPMRGGPLDRGFSDYFGIPASLDIPPYYYIHDRRPVAPPSQPIEASFSEGVTPIQGAFWRAGKVAAGFRHEEVLPELTRQAEQLISVHARREKRAPLFLYLALPAPHTPWLPTESFRGRSKAGSYGDFVMQVDQTVARVTAALDKASLADNTLVIFTSDNGPVWYAEDTKRYGHRSVGPLRGMKGDAWEGGHRMPFVVRWPGRVAAGSVSDQTICHTDLLATFAAITRQELPEQAGEDSFNLLPILESRQAGALRESTVTLSSAGYLSIRQGPWKLIQGLGSGGFSNPRRVKPEGKGPQGQLYNLQHDLGETTNVWSKHPAIVAQLSSALERIQKNGRSRPTTPKEQPR